jgi:hypothetical protein
MYIRISEIIMVLWIIMHYFAKIVVHVNESSSIRMNTIVIRRIATKKCKSDTDRMVY